MREGVLLDAASIPLEANGQTAWLIDQAFPAADTSDFAGSVRCDAVGEGLFSAVAHWKWTPALASSPPCRWCRFGAGCPGTRKPSAGATRNSGCACKPTTTWRKNAASIRPREWKQFCLRTIMGFWRRKTALERRSKRSWSELYGRQERQREQLAKDCHGVLSFLFVRASLFVAVDRASNLSERTLDPGRDVSINPNQNSILTPQPPVPDVRLGYASTGHLPPAPKFP